MKIRWLVLAALMIGMCGVASAQAVVYDDARRTYSEYDRDMLWNPLLGTRPWLEPIGYRMAPYRIDSDGRRIVEGTTVHSGVVTSSDVRTRALHHHPRGEVCGDRHHHH